MKITNTPEIYTITINAKQPKEINPIIRSFTFRMKIKSCDLTSENPPAPAYTGVDGSSLEVVSVSLFDENDSEIDPTINGDLLSY